MTERRTFLKSAGAAGALGLGGLSGCIGNITGGSQAFNDGTLDFNVSPSVAQEDLQAQYKPIREFLGNQFDVEAEMNLANNYSAVIEALGSGTADVAETGPFAAALGVKAKKAEIILQRKGYGSWTYKSIFSVAKDSDISKLSDLKGKKIAFADRLSTSGALYPLYNLKKKAGLNIGNLPEGDGSNADFEANFSSHTGAYETLVNGQADAAATGGFVPGVVENYDQNAKTIFTDDGLPRAPIVVSPTLSDDRKTAVQDAFTGAPNEIYWGADGEEGTDDDLWFTAVRKASVDKYQSVIDVANELGVGQEIFEN